jgi:hypothetical protein
VRELDQSDFGVFLRGVSPLPIGAGLKGFLHVIPAYRITRLRPALDQKSKPTFARGCATRPMRPRLQYPQRSAIGGER